ncbi:MAG TPA: hypothetical protein VI306_08610 [Pyrinomonadaceae bacterium]
MQPTCSVCWSTYLADGDEVLLCGTCGNRLWAIMTSCLADSTPSDEGQGAVTNRSREELVLPPALFNGMAAGVPLRVSRAMPVVAVKSPGLAAFLSFLLAGMGQVYLGQVEKGLCLLVAALLFVMSSVPEQLGVLILALSVVDAFVLGGKLNRGQQIGRWQFFFNRFHRPETRTERDAESNSLEQMK